MDEAKIDISTTSGSHSSHATNQVVKLNLPHSLTSMGTHLLRFSPYETLVRVTLKQECLVNTIELEGSPSPLSSLRCVPATTEDEVPTNGQNKEKFSYKVYVSKDGKNWIKLFDYSDYGCHNIQKLTFPALAFRFGINDSLSFKPLK